jgi:hypothetical protein
MSEEKGKKCSKCRTVKPLENFDDGKALCQKCSEYKQRYRENHREELRQKAKEHYEQYKGQKLEKQKEKVECPICKIDISRNKMLRHERTQRHKNNLNNTNTKQIEQPVLSDKEKKRIKHQETIDYLDDVFPSFQTPDD